METKNKFRAWDPENKRMHYDVFVKEGIACTVRSFECNNTVHDILGTHPNWILMQSTGCLDKCNNEIFEGDIYENHDYEEIFVIKYSGKEFYSEQIDNMYRDTYYYNFDIIKIIGDMFQDTDIKYKKNLT